MNNFMNKFNEVMNEAANASDAVAKALDKLVSDVKAGKGVDQRMLDKHSDGEILAMFLKPLIQGVAIELTDAKGFRNNLKKGL